ncbi:hypothetical protein L6452_13590 [Arctium lappa]|uniref:Uncharacterized protein n=1 Tax=Arctium lappa TaxID=4217 RepID=A0ACB9CJ16_ARCLA|nr:hypothetical protein L6452_13590 [Arctium lappa]
MTGGDCLELPPGFRFHPTDGELVMHYLCRKCASQTIFVPIIAEIDLYKFDMWQLPVKANWKSLAAGTGTVKRKKRGILNPYL